MRWLLQLHFKQLELCRIKCCSNYVQERWSWKSSTWVWRDGWGCCCLGWRHRRRRTRVLSYRQPYQCGDDAFVAGERWSLVEHLHMLICGQRSIAYFTLCLLFGLKFTRFVKFPVMCVCHSVFWVLSLMFRTISEYLCASGTPVHSGLLRNGLPFVFL